MGIYMPIPYETWIILMKYTFYVYSSTYASDWIPHLGLLFLMFLMLGPKISNSKIILCLFHKKKKSLKWTCIVSVCRYCILVIRVCSHLIKHFGPCISTSYGECSLTHTHTPSKRDCVCPWVWQAKPGFAGWRKYQVTYLGLASQDLENTECPKDFI